VTHRYGSATALDRVSFDVGVGEICALVGRNGAGKSTLTNIVSGLVRPSAGSVDIDGVRLSNRPAVRSKIGFAPQELALYRPLSVRENLLMFGELAGARRSDLRNRITEVSEAFGLVDMLDRVVHRLSGGEQRRVHSAAALLHRPSVLLLDEPTAGVDIQTRQHLLDAVRSVAAEDGAAVLYTTHYLPEVEALDASVAIIDAGRLIARGSITDLTSAHGFSGVELDFDGEIPDLPGAEVVNGSLRVAADDPAAAISGILGSLDTRSHVLASLRVIRPDLESVFLGLTGSDASMGTER
jgi:ABC-2 type transport system ATP-binding protein